MIVNLSVDTSSVDLMELAKDLDAFYIDTVVEPWPGLYTDQARSISERSNYALREGVLELRRRRPGGVTAVSCCGANPGMVSWMVKQALIDIARDTQLDFVEPQTASNGRALMRRVGVKGIHIAERDTQRAKSPNRAAISSIHGPSKASSRKACSPPSSAGARTRSALPARRTHDFGCDAAIYLSVRAPARACARGRRPRRRSTPG